MKYTISGFESAPGAPVEYENAQILRAISSRVSRSVCTIEFARAPRSGF